MLISASFDTHIPHIVKLFDPNVLHDPSHVMASALGGHWTKKNFKLFPISLHTLALIYAIFPFYFFFGRSAYYAVPYYLQLSMISI
jgi:hypothetical protein